MSFFVVGLTNVVLVVVVVAVVVTADVFVHNVVVAVFFPERKRPCCHFRQNQSLKLHSLQGEEGKEGEKNFFFKKTETGNESIMFPIRRKWTFLNGNFNLPFLKFRWLADRVSETKSFRENFNSKFGT